MPAASDTFTRLRDMILTETGGGPVLIEPDTSMADAIPDSLDRVEIILQVEEEFGIEISEAEALTAMATVADFVGLIDRKRGGAGMTGKLTPARIAALNADLQQIENLNKLVSSLNSLRTSPAHAEEFGVTIRRHLGGVRMHDGPDDAALGRAALDGIIANVALTRAEIEQRTAPYVDRGAA